MIRVRIGDTADVQEKLEAAIARYAETKQPADQAEAVRLYEVASRYKAGCGVCQAGRSLFIKGLGDIASGKGGDGIAKLKGALKSVSLKWDILRGRL